MKKQSSNRWVPVVAAATAITLAACAGTGGNSDSNGGDDEGVHLTYLHNLPGAYTDSIEAFEADNPGITVEEQAVPFNEMITQVQARLGSEDASIDLVNVDPPRLANMVYNGYLSPVPEDAADETASKVSEVGLNSVTYEGQQYSYPYWTGAMLLFYNKDALDTAGIEYPSSSPEDRLTWEEVLDNGKQVQAADGADYGFAIQQIDRYYALQSILMSMGAGPGLGGEDGLEVDITSDKWLEFGQWYGDLHEDEVSPRGVDPSQTDDVFMTGQVAYYLAAPTQMVNFQDSGIAGDWGIAPHPYFADGDIVTPTDSWGVGVSAYSENQEAAHELAQYLTLDVASITDLSENFNREPVHEEGYDLYIDSMTELVPNELEDLDAILTDDSEHAEHRPTSVAYVDFETEINKAFSDIRNGIDPSSALNGAQQALEAQLEQYKD